MERQVIMDFIKRYNQDPGQGVLGAVRPRMGRIGAPRSREARALFNDLDEAMALRPSN